LTVFTLTVSLVVLFGGRKRRMQFLAQPSAGSEAGCVPLLLTSTRLGTSAREQDVDACVRPAETTARYDHDWQP